MSVTEFNSGSAAIAATEYSLTGNGTVVQAQTTKGAFELVLDLNACTATEWYLLNVYEKAQSGGTQRLLDQIDLIGIWGGNRTPIQVFPPLALLWGWDFTLQLKQGTARTISYSVRQLG